ncbi:uncharacterized protein LOC123212218 [Mangifera indica]|uniref:uncharacterized protein LOC123212218 n=1 Tax=Mangifera indica TaxID=29780 RepID=UPI001CFB576F|nr:uncharacterized protein LOC123212218 [Mangifera indica]
MERSVLKKDCLGFLLVFLMKRLLILIIFRDKSSTSSINRDISDVLNCQQIHSQRFAFGNDDCGSMVMNNLSLSIFILGLLECEEVLQSNPTSSRQHHKPKYSCNRASRGSGMQAIFLESGQKSCGTGVFLPQRGGTNCQPSRKPACSPVLLPSRVVQALNLNVHAIGLQISPRKDSKANDLNSVKNKTGKDVSTKCSQHHISSPEIFLPEEWSY